MPSLLQALGGRAGLGWVGPLVRGQNWQAYYYLNVGLTLPICNPLFKICRVKMGLKEHKGPILAIFMIKPKIEAQTKLAALIKSITISKAWLIPQKITPFKILIFGGILTCHFSEWDYLELFMTDFVSKIYLWENYKWGLVAKGQIDCNQAFSYHSCEPLTKEVQI